MHNPASEIERSRLEGIDVTEMRLKKNPDLWFLDVLFFHLKRQLGSGFLIGGDFNYSRLLDDLAPRERGNHEFFDRITSEGFVSLHRLFHAADERTFFHPARAHHQLDYLYVDAPLARYARSCHVHAAQVFSDHAPLVADLGEP